MPDFINVSEILNYLDVEQGMTAAEFGCGSAAFATALAKKLKRGRMYALDIQEEKLSALRGRAHHDNLHNIIAIRCDLAVVNGSTLPSDGLDVVLITNLLFQVENKDTILKEAKRVLNKGGQMLVIDWLKQGPFSPKTGMIAPEELKKIADDLDFSVKKEFAVGDYHYGILFIKQ